MSDSVLEAPTRPELANYVGGEWAPARSGRTYQKHNPANPGEVVGEFPSSGEEDVAAAVEAAGEGFPGRSGPPGAGGGAGAVGGGGANRSGARGVGGGE